jgi:hypothetical protein
MLTWVGFIGRLLDLLLTKVAGKQIDLALDEGKRALRLFVDLYDSVDDIVALTGTFLTRLQPRPRIEGRSSQVYLTLELS